MKYTNVFSWLLVILMANALMGCAAVGYPSYPLSAGAPAIYDNVVLPLQAGTTLWGMRQVVVEQAVGTFAMMKDGNVMLIWPMAQANGWAFVVFNPNGGNGGVEAGRWGSQIVNGKTMGDLVEYLQGRGWQVTDITAVPGFQAMKAALSTSGGWLAQMANSLTTILVVPIFSDQMQMIIPAEVDT